MTYLDGVYEDSIRLNFSFRPIMLDWSSDLVFVSTEDDRETVYNFKDISFRLYSDGEYFMISLYEIKEFEIYAQSSDYSLYYIVPEYYRYIIEHCSSDIEKNYGFFIQELRHGNYEVDDNKLIFYYWSFLIAERLFENLFSGYTDTTPTKAIITVELTCSAKELFAYLIKYKMLSKGDY